MDFLNDVFQNTIFVSAALGWLIAQVLKTLIYLIINKRFVAERMVGGGGMPSSHSATVCALATAARKLRVCHLGHVCHCGYV